MKKIILSAIVVAGFTTASFAQGYLNFDGSNNTSTSPTATSEGQVFINGQLDTATDINAELVYGATAGSVSLSDSVVTLLLSQATSTTTSAVGTTQSALGDITAFASGVLFDVSGNAYAVPGSTVGGTEYFQVYAWTGDYSTYAQALAAGADTATSDVFSEVLTSATGTETDIEGMSALNLTAAVTPEPTTMALAGLGGLSLLFLRRKK